MMGQELFEHPKKQYATYRITPLIEQSEAIGSPEAHLDGSATAEQEAAMERALEGHPDAAITYDEDSQLWILGAEDDINRMFTDREEFVEALLNDQDPGI